MNKISKWLCKEFGGEKGYVNGWNIFVFGLLITLVSVFFVFMSSTIGCNIMNGTADGSDAKIVFTFNHFIVGFISICGIALLAIIIAKIFTHKFIVCPIVEKEEEKLP